jgi:release factor glutamine methyltransferase
VNRHVLSAAAARLREAGVASPDHDAAVLLAHVLGVERSQLALVDDVPADALERYDDLVARRAAREPLQHLTGLAWFRHVELAVGPGVFVPRPETELLAGWAVEAGRGLAEPVVVDLCTGSGAIALALAQEVPRSRVHAVELSEEALVWARKNTQGSKVDLRHGDALTAFPDLNGQVDLVVSNPPYIPLTEWEYVAPEARDHDPELALFSGEDGLDTIRGIERTAQRLLRPGGVVVIEHADTQGGQVPWIFKEDAGWADAADHPDLNNRPRFTTARKATP